MLVLGRKTGERIRIGDDVIVTLVRMANGVARIGVDAPLSVRVRRDEIAPISIGNAEGLVEDLGSFKREKCDEL